MKTYSLILKTSTVHVTNTIIITFVIPVFLKATPLSSHHAVGSSRGRKPLHHASSSGGTASAMPVGGSSLERGHQDMMKMDAQSEMSEVGYLTFEISCISCNGLSVDHVCIKFSCWMLFRVMGIIIYTVKYINHHSSHNCQTLYHSMGGITNYIGT
jgi:hypothetical protein